MSILKYDLYGTLFRDAFRVYDIRTLGLALRFLSEIISGNISVISVKCHCDTSQKNTNNSQQAIGQLSEKNTD